MLFPSCRRILLFPLLSSTHGPNKVLLDPSCTWIRYTRVSSWYSNGPFNSDLVETFKTNAFNAFVLDRVIGPLGTCNGSLLVFLGWSTSLCFPTSHAFITYALHIFFHFRSKKMLMQHIQSLNNTKMPHQPAFVCFTYKQFTHRT